ncbi:MAG: hypothetical protein D6730_00700 [Bacteroidetes bacterium]|nr:MAG: hypothetical protein D6730_00700 [Bacteroidota bacterium]
MQKTYITKASGLMLFLLAFAFSGSLPQLMSTATQSSRTPPTHPFTASNTSGGTIKGKVTYGGGMVHNIKPVIKDEKTCGAEDIVDESLLTDEHGGLNWAVVSIASEVKGGKSLEDMPTEIEISQQGCVFHPHVVVVPVNKALTVVNNDKTLHNVRTVAFMNDVFNKVQVYIPGSPAPKDQVTFTEPEVVEMVCDVHGWMKAYIHVVDHPYYEVTNEHGDFELTEVPAGTYTLKVWHESLGEKTQEVKVEDGQTVEVNFNFPELASKN